MSENSRIEWTDHTFNPWIGCQKVGPGCDHCYAEAMMDQRLQKVQWGPGAARERTKPANWRNPVAWNANHELFYAAHGRRQMVFCASLADVFDNAVPKQWRADLLELIDQTPNLDWLLLTKRIGNVADMLPLGWLSAHPNVWLGASIVTQEEADRDLPKLLALPAAVRFLSMEPLLGPVDFYQSSAAWSTRGYTPWRNAPILQGIGWVIVGGESGPDARPVHLEWVRSLRDQCAAAGVPFLFKQWGEWLPGIVYSQHNRGGYTRHQDGRVWPGYQTHWWEGDAFDGKISTRVGKKNAGRLLDGVLHDAFPRAVAQGVV